MPCNYREYPDNWHERRLRILSRAGEIRNKQGEITTEACCEWCAAENHRPHPRTGSLVVLTIAHLDHDHVNASVPDSRLRALCQSCHLGYDHPRHVEKARLGRDRKRGQMQLFADSLTLVETNYYGGPQ